MSIDPNCENEVSKIRENIGGFDKLDAAKKERMRISRIKKAEKAKKKALLKKANHMEVLIQETIDFFANDEMDKGAQGIEEIANIWKAAGQTKKTYLELMQHIEDQAIEKCAGSNWTRLRMRGAVEKRREKKGVIIT